MRRRKWMRSGNWNARRAKRAPGGGTGGEKNGSPIVGGGGGIEALIPGGVRVRERARIGAHGGAFGREDTTVDSGRGRGPEGREDTTVDSGGGRPEKANKSVRSPNNRVLTESGRVSRLTRSKNLLELTKKTKVVLRRKTTKNTLVILLP